jgi:hypothetical protein
MAAKSTITADRQLLRQLDAWAERNGYPYGPGHRRVAVEIAIRTLLAGADQEAAQPEATTA